MRYAKKIVEKFPQVYDYSCGASALRNVLASFGIRETEKKLRRLCKTKKKNGTDENSIISTAHKYGLKAVEYQTASSQRFERVVSRGLREGKKYVILIDGTQHWISALSIFGRRVEIVDTDFQVGTGTLNPLVTIRQLREMSHCYDKLSDKRYFYFIELTNIIEE